jgi:hypothetical protein
MGKRLRDQPEGARMRPLSRAGTRGSAKGGAYNVGHYVAYLGYFGDLGPSSGL